MLAPLADRGNGFSEQPQCSRAGTNVARVGAAMVVAIAASALIVGCVAHRSQSASDKGQAIELPTDPNALAMGAELALQHKEYRRAAQLYAAAAANSDNEEMAERATEVAFEHHQDTVALQDAERWLKLNPSSEQAHRVAGFAALRLYRIDLAAENFRVLLDHSFISPQAGFIALAPQWFDEGSRPAVLALMQTLIKNYDDKAEAHYVLAQAALQAENIALALTHAQRATELSPYWLPARSLLARAQLAAGQRDAALATARAAIDDPAQPHPSPQQRLEFAQILYAAGDEEPALATIKALTKDHDVGSLAERSLALIDMDRRNMDAAGKRWRDLVQSGRFVYEGLFYLAQIAESRGEQADAIELYSRVTAGDMAVRAQVHAAQLKAAAGKVEDGVAALRDFAAAHSNYLLDMITAEAGMYVDAGKVDKGIGILDSAIAEYPDYDDFQVSKALLLEHAGRNRDAIKVMRDLLAERPDDPTVLNMLGYTLVDSTRERREGFEMISRALMLMPDNGAVLDSMGWALHRLNRNDEALPYLQRAYEQARDPEIAAHLGEVLWLLGRHDEASKTWKDARTDFPDNAPLQAVMRKYKVK